jgi:hypothetical protein
VKIFYEVRMSRWRDELLSGLFILKKGHFVKENVELESIPKAFSH